MRAPATGKVKTIRFRKGEQVKEGMELIAFEADEACPCARKSEPLIVEDAEDAEGFKSMVIGLSSAAPASSALSVWGLLF